MKLLHDRYVLNNEGVIFDTARNEYLTQTVVKNFKRHFKIIRMVVDGKSKNHQVHSLVAKYFLENKLNHMVIDFIDGDTLNCHYQNLKWRSKRLDDGQIVELIKSAQQEHDEDQVKDAVSIRINKFILMYFADNKNYKNLYREVEPLVYKNLYLNKVADTKDMVNFVTSNALKSILSGHYYGHGFYQWISKVSVNGSMKYLRDFHSIKFDRTNEIDYDEIYALL